MPAVCQIRTADASRRPDRVRKSRGTCQYNQANQRTRATLQDASFWIYARVEVPKRPEVLPGPEEIVAKLKRLSGEHFVGAVEQRFAMHRAAGDTTGEAAYLETFYQRMWDVSMFMKAVKQRFTQWYNGRMDRKGTLWEGRSAM